VKTIKEKKNKTARKTQKKKVRKEKKVNDNDISSD
jgi:hypothetical protein